MPYLSSRDRLPRFFWICLGLALLPIGVGIGVLLVKSSNLQYQHDRVGTLNIDTARKIKQASNNTEYANKVLLSEIEELKRKVDLVVEGDRSDDPVIQSVATELQQLQPVVNEVERNNELLNEIVETQINLP